MYTKPGNPCPDYAAFGATGLPISPWSEFTSFENERFCSLACSTSLRFLHLLKKVASVPMTITTAANGMKSHEVQPLAVAAGTVETAGGVLAVSEDELAAAASAVVSAAGLLTVSEDELAVTGGVMFAPACVADRFPALVTTRAE
jgi:hypothetical protein